MPSSLCNQYKIESNEELSHLLLSPKAQNRNGLFMSCRTCYNNVMQPNVEKPPRFGISNGWAIGQIPYVLDGGEIEDILAASLAKIYIFTNMYSYITWSHKSIRGDQKNFN